MKTKIGLLVFLALLLLLTVPVFSQNATPHGIRTTATPPVVPTGGAAIAGYNIWRATGTGGPYLKLNKALLPTPSYDDLSTGLLTNTAYFYVMTAVDVNGNESLASNESNGTTPAAWPLNPNAPSGCNSKVF